MLKWQSSASTTVVLSATVAGGRGQEQRQSQRNEDIRNIHEVH